MVIILANDSMLCSVYRERMCFSGDLRNRKFNWPFECHANLNRVKRSSPHENSISENETARQQRSQCILHLAYFLLLSFGSLFIHNSTQHTSRSNRGQHNYEHREMRRHMCIFNHRFHATTNGSFSSGARCFWIKFGTETACWHCSNAASMPLLARARAQIYFWFSEFWVALFIFLLRLRAFSIPKWSRRVCPFAVIMQ